MRTPCCARPAWLLTALCAALPAQLVAQPAGSVDGAVPVITVTGTRLAGGRGAGPVQRYERAELERSGFRSLGEWLQNLPVMAGAPLSTGVGQRGSGGGLSRGIETVDLRGLGAARTLVLLDGRRLPPGGNGTAGLVDIATLPLAMIERIEVLTTGASVAYGADAVAGVVNLITRRDLPAPVLLEARMGAGSRGDAGRGSVALLGQRRLRAGNVVAGLSGFDQRAVGKGERAYSRQLLTVEGPSNRIVADGSSAPPGGNFRTSAGRLTLIEGAEGTRPEDFRPFVSSGPDSDRYNFNPDEDLVQDARRWSAFVLGRQALSDRVELVADLLWQSRTSDTTLAPLPLFTSRLPAVQVSASNLHNPFAEAITDARRRLVEAGPRQFVQQGEYRRALLGVEGVLGGGWLWDAAVSHGRQRLVQRQRGDLLADRLALALGPTVFDAAGAARCGATVEDAVDCVPLNLFGGPGSIDDAMLDFVSAGALVDRFELRQTTIDAELRGDLLSLPSGPLAAALGLALRRETGSDRPHPQTRDGNTTGAQRDRTRGRIEARSLFAELGLPLWRGGGAGALDATAGARLEVHRGFGSRLVHEFGLDYRPRPDWRLHVEHGRALRAPNIAELYGGAVQSDPAVDDPCADFSRLGATARQRCIDQGVPADGSFDQTGDEVRLLGGGNSALTPELARIDSAGLRWQPAGTGFELTLDYHAVRIRDGIAALGANTVLAQCLASGRARDCDRIKRDEGGAIIEIGSPLQNLARDSARGLDLALSQKRRAFAGSLRQRVVISHVLQRDRLAYRGAPLLQAAGRYEPDGLGAVPRWKGNYALDWAGDALELGYALQWIGPVSERGGELFPGTVRRAPHRVYHDLRAGWRWPGGARLAFSVSNLGDLAPPFLANADAANTDVASYRLLGRSLRLDLSLPLP